MYSLIMTEETSKEHKKHYIENTFKRKTQQRTMEIHNNVKRKAFHLNKIIYEKQPSWIDIVVKKEM